MQERFRGAYAALTDFIAAHPGIEIGRSVTSIPEEVRGEFYALFNAARCAFLADAFPGWLSDANDLRRAWCRAAEDAAGWLRLEDPPVVNKCSRFLRDPEDGLSRELFDPLFDLLKKKDDPEAFLRRASRGIETLFPAVYRGGFERWAVLALTGLLEVQNALRVPVRELQAADRAKSAVVAPVEEAPAPVDSSGFPFSQSPNSIFAAPDFIVYSGRLNRYVGFKSEFRKGSYNAANASRARDWRPVDAPLLEALQNGLTLVYISDKPEDIALVGDAVKFCRPDLLLWCVDERTLSAAEAVETLTRAETCIRPSRGSFLLTRGPWPEADAAPQAESAPAPGEPPPIRMLAVGLERENLAPVIEALAVEAL